MSKWPWPEYMDRAPDPLMGWEVPKEDLDDEAAVRIILSALSKLSEAHKMLENVPNLDEYHMVRDNTARTRIKTNIREARKQIHIALVAMRRNREDMERDLAYVEEQLEGPEQ